METTDGDNDNDDEEDEDDDYRSAHSSASLSNVSPIFFIINLEELNRRCWFDIHEVGGRGHET